MDSAATQQPSLRLYLVAQTTYFAAGGLSGVLIPWLLAHELHASEAVVGAAQALSALPTMLFVLFGGAAADGRNLRQYVAQLQLTVALAPIALGMAIALHALSLPLVIVYGVLLATVSAFIMPARDALLFYVAPSDLGLTRTVAFATSATFGGQLAGILLAGTASVTGAVALLAAQAALLSIAAMSTVRVRLAREQPTTTTGRLRVRASLEQVKQGIGAAWSDVRLRTVILLIVLGSPVFNGLFLVGFPLLNRAYYGNGSATLAGMPLAFMVGVTTSSLILAQLKPVLRQGRVFMFAYANSFAVMCVLHFQLPYAAIIGVIFWWGLAAGVGATISRSIVQAAAPDAYRARVLSIFQFGQVWGGPLGALVIGVCAQAFGVLNALLVPAVLTGALWLGFRVLTPLWSFERQDVLAPS